MPKGERISPPVLEQILRLYERYRKAGMGKRNACVEVAKHVPHRWEVVCSVIDRLRPTTQLAEVLIKARAFRITSKLLRKANADQLIDILSRPNIGVLGSNKAESSGPTGFFLSIQADTLGAVQVAGGQVPRALPAAQERDDEEDEPFTIDADTVESMGDEPPLTQATTVCRSAATRGALRLAKERLADAREREAERQRLFKKHPVE